MALTPLSRGVAALVAAVGWTGLAVQLDASIELTGSLGPALWAMLRFFTVLGNLLCAVVFTAIALGQSWAVRPKVISGVAMTMLLIGVVYGVLLQGLLDLSAGRQLASTLLHKVTTVLAPLWWLIFAVKGRLSFRDPLLWALFPLAYFAYGLTRGAIDGVYPYPFMNVATIGWERTAVNGAVMATAFVLAGVALVALDRWLGQRERAPA